MRRKPRTGPEHYAAGVELLNSQRKPSGDPHDEINAGELALAHAHFAAAQAAAFGALVATTGDLEAVDAASWREALGLAAPVVHGAEPLVACTRAPGIGDRIIGQCVRTGQRYTGTVREIQSGEYVIDDVCRGHGEGWVTGVRIVRFEQFEAAAILAEPIAAPLFDYRSHGLEADVTAKWREGLGPIAHGPGHAAGECTPDHPVTP